MAARNPLLWALRKIRANIRYRGYDFEDGYIYETADKAIRDWEKARRDRKCQIEQSRKVIVEKEQS